MEDKAIKYKFAGYRFCDVKDYNEAKKEAESIDYIKANTDLTDSKKVLELYHRLVEQKTLKTVVGFEFLKELQDLILKQGIISQDVLPGIPVGSKVCDMKNISTDQTELKKQAEYYQMKHRNTRIINVFLTIIIIVMFLINLFHNFMN